MRTTRLRRLTYGLMALFSSMFMLFGQPMMASADPGDTLTLSPSSGTHDIGTTFTITVNAVSVDTINAVEADLTYDAAKLHFEVITSGSSAFDVGAPSSGGSGSVTINKGSTTPLSGSNIVATVSFTVLGGSGTTAVTFASSSQMIKSGTSTNVWDGATAGGTYTLNTPSSGGTTATTSGTTSGSGGSTTPTTPAKKTTPTTPAATTPAATTPIDQPVTVQKDTSGSGYPVAISVLTSKNKAVKGATVKLNGKTATTDATGLASFPGVPAGTYTATITLGKVSVERSVTVSDGDTSSVQKFTTVLPTAKSNVLPLLIGIGGGILVLAVAGFFIVKAVIAKRAVGAVGTFAVATPTAAPIVPAQPAPTTITPNVNTTSTAPAPSIVSPSPNRFNKIQ